MSEIMATANIGTIHPRSEEVETMYGTNGGV